MFLWEPLWNGERACTSGAEGRRAALAASAAFDAIPSHGGCRCREREGKGRVDRARGGMKRTSRARGGDGGAAAGGAPGVACCARY